MDGPEGLELGGGIVLKGFGDRDYAEIIVVKKIVGRYARQLADAGQEPQSLSVGLERGSELRVVVGCTTAAGAKEAQASGKNLFIVLDAALKDLTSRLR